MLSLNLPRHLAIIMDGNGRWAQKRHHPRVFGHVRGAAVARDIITSCVKLGVPYLTLYAFSTENWKRPEAEVAFLMKLLERHLKRERQKLIDQNIRFHVLGDVSKLPAPAVLEIQKTLDATKNNSGMHLTFALNYGGRQEILAAAKNLVRKAIAGTIQADQIDEAAFNRELQASFLPDPDLIIRTSGESRLSNFFTWQSCYSEIFVTPVLWPDFDEGELARALRDYSQRQRRFGAVTTLAVEGPPAL